jgi:S1/P1 Nuclease
LNRKLTCLYILLFFCFAGPRDAEAWGCRGHEAIATLAEKHLTPDVKQTLLALLTANPIDPQLKRYCGERGLDPFVDASTLADDERSKDPATGPWHFIDIPLGVTSSAQIKSFCGSAGCVIQAITDQLAILKDKTAPGAKRAAALRFIIHFVGDLHQPLHATSNGDRGGNCVPVQYFRRKPRVKNNNYTPNLHQIWDTAVPERDMEGADAAEFADKLDAEFAGSFSAWQQGGMQLEAWAWEGHQQAVDTVYGALGTAIPREPDVPVNSCADDNNIGQRMLAKHIQVGAAYQERAAAVAEERLAQAGIRLAMILNDASKSGL